MYYLNGVAGFASGVNNVLFADCVGWVISIHAAGVFRFGAPHYAGIQIDPKVDDKTFSAYRSKNAIS